MWLKSYVLRLSRLFLPATICFPATFNFFWKTFFSHFLLEKVTTTVFGSLHLPHFFSIYVYSFWFVAIDCKIFIQLKKNLRWIFFLSSISQLEMPATFWSLNFCRFNSCGFFFKIRMKNQDFRGMFFLLK